MVVDKRSTKNYFVVVLSHLSSEESKVMMLIIDMRIARLMLHA